MQKLEEEQVSFRCKACLEDIDFKIPKDKLKAGKFPIRLEDVHGVPPHRLIIFIDKYFRVESFEIEQIVDQMPSQKKDATRAALESVGLQNQEIEIYLASINQGPMTSGEIALIVNKSPEIVNQSMQELTRQGLFKKIAGTKQYYEALPPYAALNSQLQKFSNMIEVMQDSIPKDLQMSFAKIEERAGGLKQFRKLLSDLHGMRENLSQDLSKQTEFLNSTLKDLKNQKGVLDGIESLKNQSLGLLDEHYISLFNQFEELKKKIGNNLEKLQLGILVKTVESVIEKTVDRGLEQIKKSFESNFESKFEFILNQIMKEIKSLADNADHIEGGIKDRIHTLLEDFDQSLVSTEDNLDQISGNLLQSVDQIRENFSGELVVTLDDVLTQIQKQIDLERATLTEFWENSKSGRQMTMQDVWFIQTPEGMRAQIKDALSRAKMRVLVVAPYITNLDLDAFDRIKKHINVRICAKLEDDNRLNYPYLEFFDEHPNISFRERDLTNLWGITKDYEEIILGIVNQGTDQTSTNLEVVGVGSILTEHIKIFVPILEDAWVGGQKIVTQSLVKEIRQEFGPEELQAPTEFLSQALHQQKPSVSAARNLEPMAASNTKPQFSGIKAESSAYAKDKTQLKKQFFKSIKKPEAETSVKTQEKSLPATTKTVKETPQPQSVSSPKKDTEPSLVKPSQVKADQELKQEEKISKSQVEANLKTEAKPKDYSQPVVDPFNPAYKFYQTKQKQEPKKVKLEKIDLAKKAKVSQEKALDKKKKEEPTNKKSKQSKRKKKIQFINKTHNKTINTILDKIEKIEAELAEASAKDLIPKLTELKKMYVGKTQFHRTFSEIDNWEKDLIANPVMDDFKRKIIRKRLKNWRTTLIEREDDF